MDSLPDKDMSCVNDFPAVVDAVTAQVGGISDRYGFRVPRLV